MKKILFVIVITAVALISVEGAFANKTFSVRDVKGRYVFSFQGEVIGYAVFAATGVLNADGKGKITDGVRMINFNGEPATQTFTCTIVVYPNGTGSADCPLDDPAPGFPPIETYDFVLQNRGKSFRFIATTPGTVVLGTGERQ